jgi:aryl-alcohol dehydrogenase-like predicted oxidoreductase
VLRKLKQQGKIRSFGASVDWGKEVLEVVNTSDAQVLELLFNIFHQEPVATFEAVKKKNVGVIVKVPLDSGWLSGRYHKGSTFAGIRGRWTPEVIARRCEMVEKIGFVKEGGVTLPQAALRFVLAFDVISSVMPGTRDGEHLKVSRSAAEKEMPRATVERLRAFWKAELEKDPLPW